MPALIVLLGKGRNQDSNRFRNMPTSHTVGVKSKTFNVLVWFENPDFEPTIATATATSIDTQRFNRRSTRKRREKKNKPKSLPGMISLLLLSKQVLTVIVLFYVNSYFMLSNEI